MLRYSDLTTARLQLCDLLIGRTLRLHAAEQLRRALWLEETALGLESPELQDDADRVLASAAHQEWVAERAELGQIGWGGRFNRCGFQPAEEMQ